MDLIKEIFPDRKKVGIIWNSSEVNSEAVLSRLRPHAAKIDLEIIEATVTGPSEVLDAAKSLVSRGANVFLNAGSNTLSVSFDSFVKVADQHHIPVFTVDSEHLREALVFFGPDTYQTGYDGGVYLARVLNGENTADLPIYQTSKAALGINREAAARQGFNIPEKPLKRADKVLDQEKVSP